MTVCRAERRRHDVRAMGLNGIDDIEVSAPHPVDGTVTLCVHFLGEVPGDVEVDDVRVEGGRRICGIEVLSVWPRPAMYEDDDDCLEVKLDRAGDASTYRLCLAPRKDVDTRYACRDFTFTAHCDADLDCGPAPACPPPVRAEPAVDYLAKDYAGFRRLALDRMALLVPEWRERHIPDVGVTLVELLAYVGDRLSYFQDAVATEAYLDTARRRVSVRRHARLVDYTLGEGCNARAFVVLEVSAAVTWQAADVAVVTSFPGAPPPGGPALLAEEVPLPGRHRWFEPPADGPSVLRFRPEHNTIRFHTWGDRECCLPTGATSAWLVDEGLDLHAGDFLVFEEVLGPRTGVPGDADPTRRHVVRLTALGDAVTDAVEKVAVREVTWARDDALPFPLCLSSVAGGDCRLVVDVTVARGNVVLVDDGATVGETLPAMPEPAVRVECAGECEPVRVALPGRRWTPALAWPEVTFAEPLPGVDRCGRPASATAVLRRDPSAAVPQVGLAVPGHPEQWTARRDLLGCGPDECAFVVEMEDDRTARLRFGDDRLAEAVAPGTSFAARYRVGSGPAGNVGPEALVHVALRGHREDVIVRARNPLAAIGGTAPESLVDAKQRIPVAFRAGRERAVTADDYAELAQRSAGDRVQRASAALVWTGSWYEAEVALDPRGGGAEGCGCGCAGDADECDDVVAEVEQGLAVVRRMGHDVRVEQAALVPVEVKLTVCVHAERVAAHVKAALLAAFSDEPAGFFHPDRWSFGDPLHVSALVAAAHAVPGVESAEVTHLRRQGDVDRGELAAGVLRVGRRQVVLLSGDRVQPRQGVFEVVTRGGR